jgi:DNA modification methylase
MTQQFPQTTDPDSQDSPAHELLPQQEQFYRAPARFGHAPTVSTPLGWDARNPGFRNHYPFVNLPTQIIEQVSLGHSGPHESNRLIWGDNLHVMRQIPSNSIDLIYIDPPFFSGRQYNVIWGDNNELRSFNDIWEGGMDGYLIWLNARLYEMKRLLKSTGSIYVHCDWHASHYVKIEMDKIFGFENFRNEITWQRRYGAFSTLHQSNKFGTSTDTILYYVKTQQASFFPQYSFDDTEYMEYVNKTFRHVDDDGRHYRIADLANPALRPNLIYEYKGYPPPKNGWAISKEKMEQWDSEGRLHFPKNPKGRIQRKRFLDELKGKPIQNLWSDVKMVSSQSNERIGYPTQKPEALLERIIKASSNEGDVVADFFVGGGTTTVVAQRLGRQWIACDQSRVAVAVTAERLKQQAITRGLEDTPIPDFTIEQWGIYEAERLSQMPPDQFRDFILACYDARTPSRDPGIHGYKGSRARIPVWVGPPSQKSPVTAQEVDEFAQAIASLDRYRGDEGLRDGIMLAWGFSPEAATAASEWRERQQAQIAFVRLDQVRIDSPDFRRHIASQSTERADYSEFLTFVEPPEVSFDSRRLKPLHYGFDAGDSRSYNADGEIISVQWDFNYDGRTFRAERRPWKERAALKVQHTFPRAGNFTVACMVQDDKGGQGMFSRQIKVN